MICRLTILLFLAFSITTIFGDALNSTKVIRRKGPNTRDNRPPYGYTIQNMPYSSFKQGNYVFYGMIFCLNGNSVGDDARVILYEVDDHTSMDYVTEDRVRNQRFRLIVTEDYDDWPTPSLELFIQFENCCGYWWSKRVAGYLKNGTYVSYTLRDETLFADIYV
uniref:Uncharacterized protein n=1 Tax=Panagrolaimus sp. ES5 TaxID=591445 RepID=A0AC34GBN2_9BILA